MDRVATGLAAMTSTVLASDATGFTRDVATVIAGILPDEPLVCLVIRGLGADIDRRREMPLEGIRVETLIEICRHVVESADAGVVRDSAPSAHSRAAALQRMASFEVCPVQTPGAEVVGALGMFAARPRVFDPETRRTLALLADHLGVLCEAMAERHRRVRSTEQLYAALSTRAGLDQALGILMGQRKCGREEAFDILRRTSNHRNVKVARVAADIVASVSGPPAESDGHVAGSP